MQEYRNMSCYSLIGSRIREICKIKSPPIPKPIWNLAKVKFKKKNLKVRLVTQGRVIAISFIHAILDPGKHIIIFFWWGTGPFCGSRVSAVWYLRLQTAMSGVYLAHILQTAVKIAFKSCKTNFLLSLESDTPISIFSFNHRENVYAFLSPANTLISVIANLCSFISISLCNKHISSQDCTPSF